MEELEARLRALARRKPLSGQDIVKYGPLSFDRAGRKLSALNKEIVMPRKELSIFECFFEHQNQIVSKLNLLTIFMASEAISMNGLLKLIFRGYEKAFPSPRHN